MFEAPQAWLPIAFFAAAMLYSSVGHGGASGYLAVMAFANFLPEPARITALLINIPVASLAYWNFSKRTPLRRDLLLPLLLFSVPCAFFGGLYRLPSQSYALILSLALFAGAFWLVAHRNGPESERKMPFKQALPIGAGLGVLAGLTGIGGGVFLSPLLMLGGFASAKQAAPVSAAFIVLNSVAGLAAQSQSLHKLPSEIAAIAVCAVVGGALGSYFGARHLSPPWLKRLLALVLGIAAAKLLVQAFAA